MKFEETLKRLESIVRQLEQDELDLDEALKLFGEGISQLRVAGDALRKADAEVQQLRESVDGALTVSGLDG